MTGIMSVRTLHFLQIFLWCFMMFQSSSSFPPGYCGHCLETLLQNWLLPKDELSRSLSCQIDKIFRTLKAGDGLRDSQIVSRCRSASCKVVISRQIRAPASLWTIMKSGKRPKTIMHARMYTCSESWVVFFLTVSTPWRTMCIRPTGFWPSFLDQRRAHTAFAVIASHRHTRVVLRL